jgi:hypothetical protein
MITVAALYNPVNTTVWLKPRCAIFTMAAVSGIPDSGAGLHLIQMKKHLNHMLEASEIGKQMAGRRQE